MLNASALVISGMLALGLLVAALFASASAAVSPDRKIGWQAGTAAFVVFISALSFAGAFQVWTRPPPMMIAVVLMLIVCAVIAFSPHGARLSGLPLFLLVGFHAFRLPLEMVMHRAYTEGVMPVQMSWSGRNFDVITGVSALVLGAVLLRRQLPRGALIAWNALGSALLLNIMVIAIISTPVLKAFGEDQQNTWIGFFPAVLLPTVLVPAALLGHLLLWRRLLRAA